MTEVNLARPSYRPLANPVNVVEPLYCAGYPVDLKMVKNVFNNCIVSDHVNGTNNVIFNMEKEFFSLRSKLTMFDSAGNPLLTMQRKNIISARSRFQVYKGDSTDDNDLLFSVQKSSIIQPKTDLDVFLASNTNETVCDFKIKGGWCMEQSCVVYLGESSVPIAQMNKKINAPNWLESNWCNIVNVYPHVDHAFIIALILIFNDINPSDKDQGQLTINLNSKDTACKCGHDKKIQIDRISVQRTLHLLYKCPMLLYNSIFLKKITDRH